MIIWSKRLNNVGQSLHSTKDHLNFKIVPKNKLLEMTSDEIFNMNFVILLALLEQRNIYPKLLLIVHNLLFNSPQHTIGRWFLYKGHY